MIDVKEKESTARTWAEGLGFTLPVLLDADGSVAASYAPADLLPDLPRDQVPIASNLLIDKAGVVRFYSLLDSRNFDARLVALTQKLDELLEGGKMAVVAVRSGPATKMKAGESAEVKIAVEIAFGYHVQANPASEPFLIPLRLEIEQTETLHAGDPVYPPGQPYRLKGTTEDLSTYGGSVDIVVPVEADASAAPGEQVLTGKLHYQACDAHICLAPAVVPVSLPVQIGSGSKNP